jgi:1-acyl-sn-glycerol-3-phosphate acyltransferase
MARQLDLERLKSFASADRWMELSRVVEERLEGSDIKLNEYGFDPYGVSRVAVHRLLTFLAWFYRDYFQVQVHDIDRVRPGAQLLIGNHAGAIGYDGGMAICAMLLDGRPPRLVRAMAERFLAFIPFMGTLAQRIGALTGTPQTALRMLSEGLTVLAYPEGARGTGKGWDHRYKLVEFGTGFVRLALAGKVPIQPFASVGAEEATPGIVQLTGPLAKLMKAPYVPFTPWIVPVPRPFPVDLYFGEPIELTGNPNEEDAPIQRYVETTRERIQGLIARGLDERGLSAA